MTVLARIRDRHERDVARVEVCRGAQDLAVRIVHEDQCWQEKLAELDQGKLRLVIDSGIYFEKHNGDGQKLRALIEERLDRRAKRSGTTSCLRSRRN